VAGVAELIVRAAGGIVWRAESGRLEVVVVHRPQYDDWSLPKGKAAPGESDEDCARREVEEETGLRCELGPELPSTRYLDRHGRNKVVRYWAMRPAPGDLAPDDEVDEARWVDLAEARQLISYERDIGVLDALEPALTAPGEG
jgi:8-oxo-dGTP pyrophosphatase MutT (NUDIX family)